MVYVKYIQVTTCFVDSMPSRKAIFNKKLLGNVLKYSKLGSILIASCIEKDLYPLSQ